MKVNTHAEVQRDKNETTTIIMWISAPKFQ